MTKPSGRADARRNRQRILTAALRALSDDDSAPLDGIARAAGVGIGTLYRHFPTREALVAAVFRNELDRMCARAEPLLRRHPPAEALRRWAVAYAEFVLRKRGMADALRPVTAAGVITPDDTRRQISDTLALFLAAGEQDGSLRADVRAEDVTAALIGVMLATDGRAQAVRMFALLVDGLAAGSAQRR